MDLYLAILKAFFQKENFERFSNSIDTEFLKTNFKELYQVYRGLAKAHSLADGDVTAADVTAACLMEYPGNDPANFHNLLQRIGDTETNPNILREYLVSLSRRQAASEIAFAALDVAQGKSKPEVLSELLEKYAKGNEEDGAEEVDRLLVKKDLKTLLAEQVFGGGINWRMDSLNQVLGPLRKGNFGFIFARPETGKTTFLASEVTYMAHQLDKPVLWFNNEEMGDKVLVRIMWAACGKTMPEISKHQEKAEAWYYRYTKNNIMLFDDSGITKQDIEERCKRYQPGLIVIDQLDKVHGFNDDQNHLRLGTIYQWARELSKKYGPVIGVSQAGETAEGRKFLHMGNVADAKTSKQAEADWILGIGVEHEGPEFLRGFSVCKNKLSGGPKSNEVLRHHKWEVLIRPELARYEDTAYGTGH